jgi:hypothetical protein
MTKFVEQALEEILNLADDIELGDDTPQRDAFISEFQNAVSSMKEGDWKKFYKFADDIMVRYY